VHYRIQSLIATSLAHFANDGNGYVFITLYPFLFPLTSYTLGVSNVSSLLIIGILASLLNLFSVIASPLVGRMADRTRRYGQLMSLGLFLMGVGIAGYALTNLFASGAELFFLLIPFSIIGGIGSSFYHPLGGSVLSQTWPVSSIGRAMGINGSSGSTGRAVYPLLVTSLVAFLTIPSVITLAVLSFVIGLLVVSILRRTNLGAPNTEQFGANDGKASNNSENKAKSIPVRAILNSILALTIASFMKGMFSFGIVSFIPEYLQRVSGITGFRSGLAFSLILTLPVLAQPVFGSIADRFGRRLALGITTAGSGLAIILLLYTRDAYLQVALLALFAFFTFTQFPLLMPLATSVVPKEAATLSNSIVWGFGNAGGGAVGPFIVGLLASPSYLGTLNGAFLVVTIVSIISVGILPFVPKAPKHLV
jgi:MFS transporter, FSR family, fosmidomycin resistance protein